MSRKTYLSSTQQIFIDGLLKGQALHHEQMFAVLTTLHREGIFTICTENICDQCDHCVLLFLLP